MYVHIFQITKPLHLGANIIDINSDSDSDAASLDAKSFVRLVKQYFPESTLVVGWTHAPHRTPVSKVSWSAAFNMLNTLQSSDVTQPVSVALPATLVRESIPSVKWLREMLHASVTVTSSGHDAVQPNDFLFLRNAFAHDIVFYDMHDQSKHAPETSETTQEVATQLQQLQRWRFRTEHWLVHDVITNKQLFVSRDAVVIGRGLLVYTEDPYVYTNEPMVVRARINMMRLPSEPQARRKFSFVVGLHQDPKKDPRMRDGVLCVFGADGYMRISSRVQRGDVIQPIQAVRSASGESGCLSFEIVELVGKHVTVNAQYSLNCDDVSIYRSFTTHNVTLTLDVRGTDFAGKHIVIYTANDQGLVAIESFKVN